MKRRASKYKGKELQSGLLQRADPTLRVVLLIAQLLYQYERTRLQLQHLAQSNFLHGRSFASSETQGIPDIEWSANHMTHARR